MTKLEMIMHNREILRTHGRKPHTELLWKATHTEIAFNAKIFQTRLDLDEDYTNMIGEVIGIRECDQTCIIYIPLYKTRGLSIAIPMSSIQRLGEE